MESLATVPIAALGFGTGFVHTEIPVEIIETARRVGLTLFEVPLPTPFIAISRWFADRVYDERYSLLRQIAAAQKGLVAALVNDLSLKSLVVKLSELLGGAVAVIDVHGTVLGTHPVRAVWPPVAELRTIAALAWDQDQGTDSTASDRDEESITSVAVDIEGVTVAYLCAVTRRDLDTVVQFAVSLIGLELARRQAVLTGNREMLGQVIEDVVAEHISAGEAVRRFEIHGLDVESAFRVLIGRVDGKVDRLRRVPWNLVDLVSERSSHPFAALAGGTVVVITYADDDHVESGRALLSALSRLGPGASVGVSGVHHGVQGVRVGMFEARRASSHGPGLHLAESVEALSLAGLLLSNSLVPVKDIALAALGPLIDYDTRKTADLVNTLKTYLQQDCSPARTAQALFIHRNGLQYRLDRIAELTGRNLASVEDRAHLWLALTALEMP